MNKQTGHLGQVIGHVYQLINNIQIITLKVIVPETGNSQNHELVVEDKMPAWNR
ncbi:hypothetical protein [Umezakia ovalisporum]|jgi:hypothetical protein|uniref:Uncharacterized protein n=2 Tax=Umezakia ovalisporum TaxID=75695 RepID=A0AA43GZD3_9CYAN|nr:hypothetical protein [Umezakia ovalisporum]MDH6057389.1 hypothetical protein [Umezakia ovalisporum FSS-43]MDH6064566.1 hypothetical protein [Umezakia ovalisporum FSS-62]MDH6065901.1 hypothetical protein [Umezakia ovalisporum APH033B]MDH6070779.1 hypothetical protein [Umezakia ovalisporum CobakiLakeA]MDH6078089.1 hypothetical protein [Umezakia ovalisporum FSS-45]